MKKAFSLIELSIVILIIGILIAGVTQGSRLVAQFRISNARSLTQSSPVASIKGLISWYETTSEKSFLESETEDELTISNWYDINPQSITKLDMPQSTSGNRPFYDINAINNLPALRFNGSNRYFEKSYVAELNPDNFTMFFVAKVASIPDHGALISSRSGLTFRGYIFYTNPSSVSPPTAFNMWGGNGSNWGSGQTPVNITIGQTYVLSVTYNGSSIVTYSAGTNMGSRSDTLLANNTTNIRIGAGANEGAAAYFYDGHIGEIIIYDRALKNEERNSVEKYLGQKWGTAVN
jgi:prepilin-type N-terminal cleavage/methylation domain-containing protein